MNYIGARLGANFSCIINSQWYNFYMLDIQDIQKLTELLATKTDIQEIKEDLREVKITLSGLVTAVDGLVTRVENLNQ